MNNYKMTKSNEKLIIEGNTLYEIDLECMKNREKAKERQEANSTEVQKINTRK